MSKIVKFGSILQRRALIYAPSKPASQSGTNTNYWLIKFAPQATHENPLMGWTSSNDPVQGLRVKFDSEEAAVQFCTRNGWEYTVQRPTKKNIGIRMYSDNFLHRKDARFILTK